MMDLIDRAALIASIGLANAVKWGNKDGYQQDHSYSTMMLYEIKDAIDCQPTVDAVPVVHGRWIKRGYACGENEYKCSVCGETEWRTNCERMKYCMFCGAKMDGGETDGAEGHC